ncbi:MAG: hypothetical protein WDN03_04950 [Rhizomicrobium sp.]
MAIKFPTTGVRVAQGLIYNDLETAKDPAAEPAKPVESPGLEAPRPKSHPQDHGWSR